MQKEREKIIIINKRTTTTKRNSNADLTFRVQLKCPTFDHEKS
jgi:hypothetical protein